MGIACLATWARARPGLVTPVHLEALSGLLVVDAVAFGYWLWVNTVKGWDGSAVEASPAEIEAQVAARLRAVVRHLAAHEVRLLLVFDGRVPDEKADEHERRLQARHATARSLKAAVERADTRSATRHLASLLPPHLLELMKGWAVGCRCGCEVVQAVAEADQALVDACHGREDALGVLSNDSDFLVLGVRRLFFVSALFVHWPELLRWDADGSAAPLPPGTAQCAVVEQEAVERVLKLPARSLPLLAPLLGCDYFQPECYQLLSRALRAMAHSTALFRVAEGGEGWEDEEAGEAKACVAPPPPGVRSCADCAWHAPRTLLVPPPGELDERGRSGPPTVTSKQKRKRRRVAKPQAKPRSTLDPRLAAVSTAVFKNGRATVEAVLPAADFVRALPRFDAHCPSCRRRVAYVVAAAAFGAPLTIRAGEVHDALASASDALRGSAEAVQTELPRALEMLLAPGELAPPAVSRGELQFLHAVRSGAPLRLDPGFHAAAATEHLALAFGPAPAPDGAGAGAASGRRLLTLHLGGLRTVRALRAAGAMGASASVFEVARGAGGGSRAGGGGDGGGGGDVGVQARAPHSSAGWALAGVLFALLQHASAHAGKWTASAGACHPSLLRAGLDPAALAVESCPRAMAARVAAAVEAMPREEQRAAHVALESMLHASGAGEHVAALAGAASVLLCEPGAPGTLLPYWGALQVGQALRCVLR